MRRWLKADQGPRRGSDRTRQGCQQGHAAAGAGRWTIRRGACCPLLPGRRTATNRSSSGISGLAGTDARALAKVVSGGELSRISLAIQVVTSQVASVPTLIFDEVDVGIGGGVAEVVGTFILLFRSLSVSLPHVAFG